MTTTTLSRHFRAQIGTSPADWIARARIRRAQRWLETTEWTVDRLAAEVGFRAAAVMREHFGQIVGTTPLAYRRAFYRGTESRTGPGSRLGFRSVTVTTNGVDGM
jgi:transcriptional regulator GlxA family with amidase domain